MTLIAIVLLILAYVLVKEKNSLTQHRLRQLSGSGCLVGSFGMVVNAYGTLAGIILFLGLVPTTVMLCACFYSQKQAKITP